MTKVSKVHLRVYVMLPPVLMKSVCFAIMKPKSRCNPTIWKGRKDCSIKIIDETDYKSYISL